MTVAIQSDTMVDPEEADAAPRPGNPCLRKSFSSLLKKRWSNYRKALKRCRNEFSEKSVHALRVEIRRVLAGLTLLGAVMTGEVIEPIRKALKGRLKALSRLRDTQVQVRFLKQRSRTCPGLEEFQEFLRRKERRLVRRLRRELEESGTGRLTRRVRRLRRSLEQAMDTAGHALKVETALHHAIRRAFDEVAARYREVDAVEPATFHPMRVAFKKFRYMVESLAKLQPGVTARPLRAMHAYQTRMGGIQDMEVLIVRAKKFAQKSKPSALLPFQRELIQLRTRLVTQFLASADRLQNFCPSSCADTRGRSFARR